VQVNFNSLAECSSTRELARVLLSPAGPLAWASGRAGWAQPSHMG